MRRLFGRFLTHESGATSVEYGLICALIFLAIVGAVNSFATATGVMYAHISANMK
jgi:pilus assembly protein Flp/PilA